MSSPPPEPQGRAVPDADQLTAWFTAALVRAGAGKAPSAEADEGGSTGAHAGRFDEFAGEASSPSPSALVTVTADAAGTPVIDVPASGWVAAATCARDELGMDFLDWLSAVDEPDADPAGLDVVLHLAATGSFATPDRTVRRLLLRTRVPETALNLPSLTALWPGVAWHERETFEMFGLAFTGFEDGSGAGLRPLLLPDGFEGTPLRKSFVLAARAAKAWPGAKDPGDSAGKAPRRKTLPPGVPDPSWGPHEPGAPREVTPPVRPRRERPAGISRAATAARKAAVTPPPNPTPPTATPPPTQHASQLSPPPEDPQGQA